VATIVVGVVLAIACLRRPKTSAASG